MDWVEIAEELEVSTSTRINCECGVGKTAQVTHNFNHYRLWCYRCSRQEIKKKSNVKLTVKGKELCQKLELPKDFTTEIPDIAMVWLWKRGIGKALWTKYNLGWIEEVNRLIVPCRKQGKLVGVIARDVTGTMERKVLNSVGRTDSWFYAVNEHSLLPMTLVVVEDCFSCMKVGEVQDCVALNGTSLDHEGVLKCLKYSTVVVLLDPDDAGRRASSKIKKQLGSLVDVRVLCPDKDPKYLTKEEICSLLLKVMT